MRDEPRLPPVGPPRGVIIAVSEIPVFMSAWFVWQRDLDDGTVLDWAHGLKREMPGRGEVYVRTFDRVTRARLARQSGWAELWRQQETDLWRLRRGLRPW